MRYLLICAMDSEADGFRAMLSDRVDEELSGMLFSSGDLKGIPVTVVKCGVGKVNAALCAQTAILRFAPSAVINVGVAGGVGKGVVTGHVVIADDTIQYDFDLTAIGEEDGLVSACDSTLALALYSAARTVLPEDRVSLGRIATGDRFVGDSLTASRIRDHYNALACEMEGGAVAQVCARSGVPCGVLRAISDNANEHSEVDFPTFLASAVADTEKILFSYFSSLKVD
ncbi:MAG: 5'-methylthioadenosine/adenosylhomocysteine nucleosidase [Clostridia bacterium]|nr:5'-methylthioadenosine/adenosylhomocysteine nucleosidase [Clostridia bacterium]MBQ4323057.1 5'-methylthioadenosine/adenosylhomocysteine nucleosidase [Clostridia bacterium]